MFAPQGLSTIDWIVVVVYGVGMIVLGIVVAGRQASAKDYFVAGGSMGSFAIGISIFATLLSTISYLATPGEIIKSGPVIVVSAVGPIFSYFIVGFWLIPAIMKYRVTSAYELLEQKIGLGGRMMGASMFIVLRLLWMGMMLNMCGEALVHMMGLPDSAQPIVVIAAGAVAVGYTALGGLRAVVITDVVQFLVLVGGALLTLVLITINLGGFSWIPTEWSTHWDTQPVLPTSVHTRVSVLGTIVQVVVWWVCTAGSDQTAIQRYMATPDEATARRSFLINSAADVGVMFLLSLVGFALLGFYTTHPQFVTGGQIAEEADQLFPQFIANQLPVGISGLVIVALFAAAMSSVDSGINAIAAVVTTDFINRFRAAPADDREQLWLARVMTVIIGVIIVALNTVVDRVPGNYLEASQKVVGLAVGPLFGLFFLALFVRWANQAGAIMGAIAGLVVAALVAYWDVLTGHAAISFQWLNLSSMVASIVVGVVASSITSSKRM